MDIYRIGVALSMTSNASGVLGALSTQLLHTHAQVNHLQSAFSRLGLAMGGALSVAAGTAVLGTMSKIEKAGEKLIHAQQVFAAGLPAHNRAAEMAKVTAAAWAEAGRNMNTTVSGNVEMLHDLFNVTQSINHSIDLLPMVTKLQTALNAVKDGHGVGEAASTRNIGSALRGFELLGRTDPHALDKMAEMFLGSTIALRGRVDGSTLLTQIQNAGAARGGWSDEFAAKILPALINQMGSRTGNALYNLDRSLITGVVSSDEQAREQIKWGLHSESDAIKNGKKITGFRGSSVWEAALLKENPLEWANKYRTYLKDVKHVDIDNQQTMIDIAKAAGRGNKYLQVALEELLAPNYNRQINKEYGNIGNVGKDALDILQSNDPKLLRQALHSQWENLMTALGGPMVKPALVALKSLTEVIRDISQAAAANPEVVEKLGRGVAALGIGLVGAGGAAILAAIGPVGWLVGGIAALGAAFAVSNPGAFKAALVAVKDALVYAYDSVKGTVTDPKVLAQLSAFWQGAKVTALEIYTAAKGFVLSPEFLNPLKEFWQTTVGEAKSIYEWVKAGLADPKTGETIRGTLKTTMVEIRAILDWYRSAKEYLAGIMGEGTGKLFDLKSLGLDANGDILGQLSTKLRESLVEAGKAMADGAAALAAEIKSWPGKLASAIAEMGASLVAAIGDMFRSLFGKLNPFSKTSFESGGVGSMFQTASYSPGGGLGGGGGGTFGGKALPVDGGLGIGHAASKQERAAYIRAAALARGIDPEVALRVAQSEGFNRYVGDYGTSFGDFQLHYGGSGIRGMNSMGEGDLFTRATGLSAKDPRNWKKAIDWALDRARKNGWGAWHGAARAGIGNRQGIGTVRPQAMKEPPAVGAPPRHQEQPIVLHVNLDGERVHRSVMKRIVNKSKFPTSVGQVDGYGTHLPPSTTLLDA